MLQRSSRRMKWAEHVACVGVRRGANSVLMGKSEGERPLGTPRRKWENNAEMDLQEVGWARGLDRSGSEYGRVACFVNALINLRVP
jgi:hypothetical protein